MAEVGDNTAGFLSVRHESEWAALRPNFFIFLAQIDPRFCPGHEQRCRFGPSLLVSHALSPHLQRVWGSAGVAQGQKSLEKEGQEMEIRVDVPGSDSLGGNWPPAFVFGHYLLGMQVGKRALKSPSVPMTVAGRGRLCWVSWASSSGALVPPGYSIPS